MANTNDFKVTVEELTAVANGIRLLFNQDLTNVSENYAWTTSYITNLQQAKTLLTQMITKVDTAMADSTTSQTTLTALKTRIEALIAKLNKAIQDKTAAEQAQAEAEAAQATAEGERDEALDDKAQAEAERDEAVAALGDIEDLIVAGEILTLDPSQDAEEIIEKIEEFFEDREEVDGAHYYVLDDGVITEITAEQASEYINESEYEISFGFETPTDEDAEENTVYVVMELEDFRAIIEDMAEEAIEKEFDGEDLGLDDRLALILDDLFSIVDGLNEQVAEYTATGFELVQTTQVSSGDEIFTTIQGLEDARRLTMTQEQQEAEKYVIYVCKALFNLNQSFLCTGLVDGVRQNGAFFYRSNQDNHFYNLSAPNSKAVLGAGWYLMRIVLQQGVVDNAEV